MKRRTLKSVSVFLSVLFVLLSVSFVSFAEDEKLTFNDDGKFTILQITDPQDDKYIAHKLPAFIEKAIEHADPDLIVITGDIVENSRVADAGVDDEGWREGVTVDGNYEETLSNTKSACQQIFSIIEEKGIPFAIAQGNNDYSSGVNNSDWLDIYSSYNYCLVKDESPDSDGRIDYSLPIYSSDGERLAFNLYMMDSGRGVSTEQINWYKNKSNELKAENGETVKSFVFQHVPVDDVGNLFVECSPLSKDSVCALGKWYKLGENASGHFEDLYKPGKTTAEFTAWKEQGDVIGAYFGHIHTDGYTGTWDGIELGLTYGCQFAKSGPYGVRVFTLDENDIENYDNILYTYTNGNFVVQNGNDFNAENIFVKLFALLKALILNMFK